MDQVKQLIHELLHDAPLFTLATCVNNQPWCCDMIFVWDDDFNMYWLSSPDARHSKEIEQNSKVGATVTLVDQDGKGKSLQIEGEGFVIEDDKRRFEADKNFKDRHHMTGLLTLEQALEETKKLNLYQLKPTKIFLTHEPKFGRERKEYIPEK